MSNKTFLWIMASLWAFSLVLATIFLTSGKKTSAASPLAIEGRIAIIEIFDAITYTGESGVLESLQPRAALSWLEELQTAANDPLTIAIILRINSPGGTVGATQEIRAAIKRAREKGKIVIASFGDIAASGGYYIATACDKIVSLPGTLTGSIGVIMQGYQYDELLKKIGIQPRVIKSGKNKDIMAGYRSMSPEEAAILQELVSNTYEQFLAAVIEGRKLSRREVLPLADGRIFTGEQAYQAKLVDALGTFEDAVNLAREMTKSPHATLYYPSEENLKLKRLLRRLSLGSTKSLPQTFSRLPYTTLWYYTTY